VAGLRRASLAFAAGAVGALASSVALWLAGSAGLTAALGVAVAPALSPAWLHPRLVWGGVWAGLFLLPLWRGRGLRRGLLLSLAPSAAQLLWLFPQQGRGWLGLELGLLTPAVVLVANAVWGVTAMAWLRWTR